MFGNSRQKFHCGLHIMDTQAKLMEIKGIGKQQLQAGRRQTVTLEAGSIVNGEILNEDSVVRSLEAMVEPMQLEGATVNITVPTSNVILRRSAFASLKDKELRNLIDVQLHGGGAKIPFQNPVFDFIRLGPSMDDITTTSGTAGDILVQSKSIKKLKSMKQEDILVFATPVEVMEMYTKVVKRAGLTPVFVEPSLLSLYRVLVRYWRYGSEVVPKRFVVLQTNPSHTELSIFAHGIPVFMLVMNTLNGSNYASVEAYACGLRTELSRVLNYYKYSSPEKTEMEHMYIFGEREWTHMLPKTLEKIFTGGITPLSIGGLLNLNETNVDPYAVSFGLALKGA